MRSRTLERVREKALKIIKDLEGEGMRTLTELKVLIERAIQNRLEASVPSTGKTAALRGQAERVFTRLQLPRPTEVTS